VTIRARLFLLVGSTVAATAALVTWTVSNAAGRAFESFDRQRSAMLIAQFQREFTQQGEEIARGVDRLVASEGFQRLAVELGRHQGEFGVFVNEAPQLASAYNLNVLDLVATDGTLISSAEWPARFGYQHPLAARVTGGDAGPVFQRVDLPHESMLAIVVIRRVNAGPRPVHIVGGRLIDQRFFLSFTLPDGVRAMLYRNFEPELGSNGLISASGVTSLSTSLARLVSDVRQSGRETLATVASPELETVDAIPLFGADHGVLGVLLVAASNREAAALLGRMRVSGLAFGAAGVLLGLLSSYLLARRVTRPVESLAVAAQEIAAGRWEARTDDVHASGEIGALARAFDTMARELSHQRERLIQAERVAAWRELARRLAHELKNPLFPLRLTIDNLRRAKNLPSAEFNEVFDESLATMSDGLANLNTIVGRFSDFARMPAPELGPVTPNAVIERVVRLFQAQMDTTSPSPIRVSLDLDPASPVIRADEEQLARVMQNLVLNAIDAMPDGGTLGISTRTNGSTFTIDVCDTGGGLTNEERQRLFTPYYTTKQHGTGLGLAIVQSVVSDHGGKVWVDSAPGRGTTIHLAFQK